MSSATCYFAFTTLCSWKSRVPTSRSKTTGGIPPELSESPTRDKSARLSCLLPKAMGFCPSRDFQAHGGTMSRLCGHCGLPLELSPTRHVKSCCMYHSNGMRSDFDFATITSCPGPSHSSPLASSAETSNWYTSNSLAFSSPLSRIFGSGLRMKGAEREPSPRPTHPTQEPESKHEGR